MTASTAAPESTATPNASRYLEQIEAIKRDATALALELTDNQANWRPAPDRWSIAQCLAHIVLIARPYLRGIERAIAEAKRREAAGQPPYRQGILANWMARSLEPPPGIRARTFRSLEPPDKPPIRVTLEELIALQDELGARIRDAGAVNLDAGRMRSPLLGLMKLTADQAVRTHLAHTRRHLWQAWQVRKSPRFPS
jgi:hypothetical protein